jgi:hypothetical protein
MAGQHLVGIAGIELLPFDQLGIDRAQAPVELLGDELFVEPLRWFRRVRDGETVPASTTEWAGRLRLRWWG